MAVVHRLQRDAALSRVIDASPGWIRWAGYYMLVLSILIRGQTETRQFIYVNF